MSFHFGTVQEAVAGVFAGIAVLVVLIFVIVAAKTRSDVPYERIQEAGYRIRKPWLAFLAGLLVVVLGVAGFVVPYAGGGGPRTLVKVTAGQFYWALDPPQVPVGTKVRFDVTSRDVNHGFGLYDPRGQLIGSVQAMPGYHNRLDLTLSEPGVYHIYCLEYCGLDHHLMQGVFDVVG